MKTKRHCPSCTRILRKGTGRKAWVMEPDGTIKSGIVCLRCAARAVAFVVPPATTLAPPCACCKRKLAKVCGECHDRLEKSVRELTKANVMLDQALKSYGFA